jgi:hypothetical protein
LGLRDQLANPLLLVPDEPLHLPVPHRQVDDGGHQDEADERGDGQLRAAGALPGTDVMIFLNIFAEHLAKYLAKNFAKHLAKNYANHLAKNMLLLKRRFAKISS